MSRKNRLWGLTGRVALAALVLALVLPVASMASGMGFFFAGKIGDERWSMINPSDNEYYALFIQYNPDGSYLGCFGEEVDPNGEFSEDDYDEDDNDGMMEVIAARIGDGDTFESPGISVTKKRNDIGGPIPFWVFALPTECDTEGDCEDELINCARCEMDDDGVATDTLANYGIPGGDCDR